MRTTIHASGASLRRCAGAALILLAAVGCTGSSDRMVVAEAPSVEDQIKQVESNANMPEGQKAAIIAQLRQQQAVSGQRGQASAK